MTSKTRPFIGMAMGVCLGAGAFLGFSACSKTDTQKDKTAEAGTPAPTTAIGVNLGMVQVKTVDGVPKNLPAQLPKPVVINLWATWCAPCVKELPSLQTLAKSGKVEVMAISIDDKPDAIKSFLVANHLTELPVLWDPGAQALYQHVPVAGVPTTFILDKNMTVRGIQEGERDWASDQMFAKIRNILQKAGAR